MGDYITLTLLRAEFECTKDLFIYGGSHTVMMRYDNLISDQYEENHWILLPYLYFIERYALPYFTVETAFSVLLIMLAFLSH